VSGLAVGVGEVEVLVAAGVANEVGFLWSEGLGVGEEAGEADQLSLPCRFSAGLSLPCKFSAGLSLMREGEGLGGGDSSTGAVVGARARAD